MRWWPSCRVQGVVADRVGLADATIGGALVLAAVVMWIRVARPAFLATLDDRATEPAVVPQAAPGV